MEHDIQQGSNLSKIIFGSVEAVLALLKEQFGLPELTPINFSQTLANYSVKRNLLLVEPIAGKQKIGVEQIEEVIRFSHQKPHLSEDALIIIKPFDSVSLEAQNKLLKLIEEPPVYLKILLILEQPPEVGRVITTIISRCEVLNLNSNDPESKLTESTASSWQKLAADMLRSEQQLMNAYQQLLSELDKLKESSAKNQALKQLIQALNQQELKLDKRLKLHDRLTQSSKALAANVNPKLIIDKLFLDLRQIV